MYLPRKQKAKQLSAVKVGRVCVPPPGVGKSSLDLVKLVSLELDIYATPYVGK
jgi:hypothetical protein